MRRTDHPENDHDERGHIIEMGTISTYDFGGMGVVTSFEGSWKFATRPEQLIEPQEHRDGECCPRVFGWPLHELIEMCELEKALEDVE